MKIAFAYEINDYSIFNNNYNILYLNYENFNRINKIINSMKYFSCNVDNIFQNLLSQSYNIDITKILIIEFEFYQMKEKFQKLFPNFQYLIIQKNNDFNYVTLMVNLNRRSDRIENFYNTYIKKYPNFFKKLIRFPAVDGKTYDFKDDMHLFNLRQLPFKAQRNPYQNHGYKAGVLGCALSHFNIWKKLVETDQQKENDFILVLEDDIKLCDNFDIKLNELLNDLNKDEKWGICFVGFTDYKDFGDTKISDKLIQFSGETRLNGGGTFAYLIRKKGARKLVENALKYKIQQAIDWFMIEQMDEIIMYKCVQDLVFSAVANNDPNSDSDVQNLNHKIINLN